ncbi:Methyltransferase domain-containing protein [Prauserella aidingensis]|uniref:class I SAM-dependent methyltransferase n=1 Tax=Prauserella aidingensis TaxID=387890 RepID=UPI0020A35CDD|nr:class I SAM-dependent methyltransferase [Prauserella aidingensis]MCP2255347.1 Methyltransferase domain-containing protein [Prauserella aidingensis]
MTDTVAQRNFDESYTGGGAPWVIDEPQPAVVALERDGGIGGRVLDAGCGTGEHTLLLARRGHDVLGVDFAPHAVERATELARSRGVDAHFRVADAFDLDRELGAGGNDGDPGAPFDTILDSALFHVFEPADQRRYADVLHRITRPGAVVHVLALAESEDPGFGPRISDAAVRDAFADGWTIEELTSNRYRAVARGGDAEALGVPSGTVVDLPAWLARIRRD